MRIQDVENTLLQFAEGDAPATPGSGLVKIYAKSDGKMYCKDDAGTEYALVNAAETKSFGPYIDGVLAVETNAASFLAPCDLTITEILAAVDTAPTGANLIIDVNKNGTTMYTTQGNRPTIAATETTETATDPDVISITKGDKISIDIDQIGSTVAGENLSIVIICEVA